MNGFADTIKKECLNEGFLDCSISSAQNLAQEKELYKQWLSKGYHGKMQYLENHLDMRFNPELLMPNTKSIVTVLLNYYPEKQMAITDNYRIAKYAYGQDYHHIIKDKLNKVATKCQQKFGSFNYRSFTDSAPIPDRLWAKKGGLGWIGKNTLLINKDHGSFFLIGHLFIDIEIEANNSFQEDMCLDCNKCIQACPTNALFEPYKIDAQKCLSYQTIENKSANKDIEPKDFRNWIFGCDICQDVCPFNKNAKAHQTEELNAHPQLFNLNKSKWEQIEAMEFGEIFRGTPVKRAGYKRMLQNVKWISA